MRAAFTASGAARTKRAGIGAPEEAEPQPADDYVPPPPAPPTRVVGSNPSGGHLLELYQDFIGNGVIDTLRIESDGLPVDGGRIRLTISIAGEEVHQVGWGTLYELGLHDIPPDTPEEEKQLILRASLEEKLNDVSAAPFDRRWAQQPWTRPEPDCLYDPRNCIALELLREAGDAEPPWRNITARFDRAAVESIVQDMLENTAYQLSLLYGYESSVTLAWSHERERFFTLIACC